MTHVLHDIHLNDRFPGLIYAKLYEMDGNVKTLIISATLDYILRRVYEENWTVQGVGRHRAETRADLPK